MSSARRIAIIAAMENEIAPLVHRWRKQGKDVQHKSIRLLDGYVCEGTRLIVGGIGRKSAAVAARVVIEHHEPELIVSAGLAGALRSGLEAGTVLRPKTIYDDSSGEKYTSAGKGSGGLVTAESVLSRKEKEELAQKYGADAVDMEAAVVAEIARVAGIPFMAVKAISDAADFPMPPLGRFIDANGQVNLLKLIGFAALRPQIWPALNTLRRNSRTAAEGLAEELEKVIGESEVRD